MLREALLPNHRRRIVERLREPGEHLVDLAFADDQRRTERDDVARHVAQYHAVMLRAPDQERGNARLRIEALLRRLVADDLDRADQAHAPRVTDQRMIVAATDTGLHSRRDAAHVREDVALLVDLQRLERNRRGHRVRRIRVTMAEDAELVAL